MIADRMVDVEELRRERDRLYVELQRDRAELRRSINRLTKPERYTPTPPPMRSVAAGE